MTSTFDLSKLNIGPSKTPMSMSVLRDMMSDAHNLDSSENIKLENEDVAFLLAIDPDLSNFTPVQIAGLMSHKRKAALRGCGSVYPTNIVEIPIVHKVSYPKIIMKKDRPENVRKDVPLYEDIRYASQLFTRDNFLDDLSRAKDVAEFHGIDIQGLTIDEYPCDYYYDNFMTGPSKYGMDPSEISVKKAITRLGEERKSNKLTTIWAENSKALVRYALAGFTHITVLYPDGYTKMHHERIKKYALEQCPGVEIVAKDICSEVELVQLTSEQFVEQYNLDKESTLMIHYLPQFMHLRYVFKDFSCMYLDEDVQLASHLMEIPVFDGSMAAMLNYYNCWFVENLMKGVIKGHCGIYDSIRRIRVSFSQHGAFLDHIRNVSDFGLADFVVQDLNTYVGLASALKLKICTKFFPDVDIEDELNETGDWEIFKSSAIDVSWLDLPQTVVYLPSVEFDVCETDPFGNLIFGNTVFPGFPPERRCHVVLNRNELCVLDIVYGRKDYYTRRKLIPPEFRVEASSIQMWEHAYIVFPFSSSPVTTFRVDSNIRLDILFNEKVFKSFNEWVFPGVAFNDELGKFVWDVNSYMYMGPFSFEHYVSGRERYYEFETQLSVRKALRFGSGDIFIEVPRSLSEDFITSENMQFLLTEVLPDNYRDICVVGMSPYFVGDSAGEYSEVADVIYDDVYEHDNLLDILSYNRVDQQFVMHNRNLTYWCRFESNFGSVMGTDVVLNVQGGYWLKDGVSSQYIPDLYLQI